MHKKKNDGLIPVTLTDAQIQIIQAIARLERRTFQSLLDEIGNKCLEKVLDDFFEVRWRQKRKH